MDLRNSNGIELRNFHVTTIWNLFSKMFIMQKWKMHHMEVNSDTSKSSE